MTDVEVLELLQAKGPMTLKELGGTDGILRRLQRMKARGVVYQPKERHWVASKPDEIDLHHRRAMLRCEACGEPFYWYGGEWRRQEYCEKGHPPRGARVFQGIPAWLRARLNEAFPDAINARFSRSKTPRRKRLGSRVEAELFLTSSFDDGRFQALFDHCGHDKQNNFICEPYADQAAITELARTFAEKLDVVVTVTTPSWHAPWIADCVRITFFNPIVKEKP